MLLKRQYDFQRGCALGEHVLNPSGWFELLGQGTVSHERQQVTFEILGRGPFTREVHRAPPSLEERFARALSGSTLLIGGRSHFVSDRGSAAGAVCWSAAHRTVLCLPSNAAALAVGNIPR